MFQHDAPRTKRAMRAMSAMACARTGACACPRQVLLVLACVYWLNRDWLGCNHNIFFLLLWCACRNGCDKAECGQQCNALGHLSLLSLFEGPDTASCQFDPVFTVRDTWVFLGQIIPQLRPIGYGSRFNRRNCDSKAAVVRPVTGRRARCCGCITKPPRYRCHFSGDMLRKTVSRRRRPHRIQPPGLPAKSQSRRPSAHTAPCRG